MNKDEALRLALEVIELARATHEVMLLSDPPQKAWKYHNVDWKLLHAVTAIKQALAQPVATNDISQDRVDETAKQRHEPEPVAWGVDWSKAGDSPCVSIIKRLPGGCIEVVAVEYGPKREWQGLTDEEVFDIWLNEMPAPDKVFYQKLCRSVEAKLKEKNNG